MVLIAATGWSYRPALAATFLYDDRPGITENESIRSWVTAFTPASTSPLSGRPLANLTFAANHSLGHGPAGYHATNVLIHMVSVLALLGFLRRTLAMRSLPVLGLSADMVAFCVAGAWAVHPLNTASVTYAFQRVESLMGLLYLLTLYCAVRAANSAAASSRWRAAAVMFCALGMATKEAMATAPLMVWLWHAVFAGGAWNPLADRVQRGFFGALASTWLVLGSLILTGTEATTALSSAFTGSRSFGWTPWNYLLTQAGVLVHYVKLVAVPSPLVFDYYGWPRAMSLLDVWPQLLLVLVLASTTIMALNNRHPLGFAGAGFFLVLAPTSSFVPIPTEIVAEHRMYLPSIGVIAVVTAVVIAALRRLLPTRNSLQLTTMVASGIVIFILASATQARSRDYGNEPGMWLDTITKRPNNARARVNYGIWLMSSGRYRDAEFQMRHASQSWSDDETLAQIHVQWGAALCAQSKCREGIPHLERALQLHPEVDDAHAVLGQAFSDIGDFQRALYYLRRAIETHPDNPDLLVRTGWLLATVPDASLRDARYAKLLAERAVALTSRRDVTALETLAAAHAAAGEFQAAVQVAMEALRHARATGKEDVAMLLEERLRQYRSRTR